LGRILDEVLVEDLEVCSGFAAEGFSGRPRFFHPFPWAKLSILSLYAL
jgi:hypothetical protein